LVAARGSGALADEGEDQFASRHGVAGEGAEFDHRAEQGVDFHRPAACHNLAQLVRRQQPAVATYNGDLRPRRDTGASRKTRARRQRFSAIWRAASVLASQNARAIV
jgi:hypothetical protein